MNETAKEVTPAGSLLDDFTFGMVGADPAFVARATALRPLLREQAMAGERARRLADVTVEAMRAAGLLNALVPARLGGQAQRLRTLHEAIAELSAATGPPAGSPPS